ncbi:MAG: beta-propeller domain-containing protein, partial [Thermoanaerobaculales bacterium]|nr:beta-propeller domain-containing protein [Thermoanaerobaculales bacterium]
DPTEPRLTGELKIPGYSAYLHPMDHNHLLAIGMNGDDEGRLHGLAVKIFDVADLENPALLHDYVLESPGNDWSWSEALADHHAFTFRNDVLSLPAVQGSWSGNLFAGLLLLSVDLDDGIDELGRVNHDDLPTESSGDWSWSALVRRSLFIEDNVYSLSRRGMKVNNLYDPEIEYAAVPFDDPEPEVSPLAIDRPR